MKNLYLKLAEVKREVGKVSKNSKNPHFKNTYADLNALIDAVEPILLEKGLLMLQPIAEGKVCTVIFDVETELSIESSIALPALQDPQKLGSAITYFRRYTLQSLLSLQAEDDDANKASRKDTLSDERFTNALQAIADGKATKESLINNFTLTANQLAQLK
jgi:hypothetical protein